MVPALNASLTVACAMKDGHFFLPGAKTMTKDEIISAVASTCNQPKEVVKLVISTYCDVISNEISNGSDTPLGSLGAFKVKIVPAHAGRNPKTGEALHILQAWRVKFTPSAFLKRAVSSS